MDLAEEEEAATAEVIMAAATVEATAEVITVAAMVAATAEVITDLIALTPINLPEQKVGKIEVMEILLKTLNMKVVGAGEKGECQIRVILQTIQIRNPFL